MAIDRWASGNDYDPYMGRWSRLVAPEFVRWLAVEPGARWLDVGCGTGALAETVLDVASPASVTGIDPSAGFVDFGRQRLAGRAVLEVGDAQELPYPDDSFDAVGSGLVLNFVPDPARACAEIGRVLRGGGTAGAYIWDYPGMQMMARFWDVAVSVDWNVTSDHETARFAGWNLDRLRELLDAAGFADIAEREIVVTTMFADFDDYWTPFLGGQGVAPAYLRSLPDEVQEVIREGLREHLPIAPDGSITLSARAWAVKGRAPA